jgi:sialate O-acetylesterase
MLKGMPSTQSWVDSAERPEIRFRRINDPVLEDGDAEAADLATADAWVPMDPQTVLTFSAVAASFARKLADEQKVPVGIIDVSWGGKPIEPFIPRENFSIPLLKQIKSLADEEKLDELAALRGGVIIRNPQGYPGAIFNARMAPLTQFGLRGFLWYQAESNAGKGEDPREYRHKMAALITGWRSRWENTELPCYFVQLPSFPSAPGWIRVREEQRRALSISKTGMAVTIDIRGEDIHPADKIPVGERLARLALSRTYGHDDVVASGPLYRDHAVEGSAIRVRFDFAESGLMVGDRPDAGPVVETGDAASRWFELAGEDGAWHSATAKIDGREVVVTSAAVEAPIAVRYACDTQPQGGNLYNRAGLPASPFCSKLEWLPWEKP